MGYVKSSFSEINNEIMLEVRGKKYEAKYLNYHFIKKAMLNRRIYE